MKTIKVGSVVSQKNGNRFGVTKLVDDNKFFAIFVGDKSFTDRTTFNGFMRHGDFRTDNILFTKTANGFRKVQSIGGMLGLATNDKSLSAFDLLND